MKQILNILLVIYLKKYRSFAIYLSFPVDQIRCDVHHIQNFIDGVVPVIKQTDLVLNRFEINCISNSIDSTTYYFAIIQHTEFFLAIIFLNIN